MYAYTVFFVSMSAIRSAIFGMTCYPSLLAKLHFIQWNVITADANTQPTQKAVQDAK